MKRLTLFLSVAVASYALAQSVMTTKPKSEKKQPNQTEVLKAAMPDEGLGGLGVGTALLGTGTGSLGTRGSASSAKTTKPKSAH